MNWLRQWCSQRESNGAETLQHLTPAMEINDEYDTHGRDERVLWMRTARQSIAEIHHYIEPLAVLAMLGRTDPSAWKAFITTELWPLPTSDVLRRVGEERIDAMAVNAPLVGFEVRITSPSHVTELLSHGLRPRSVSQEFQDYYAQFHASKPSPDLDSRLPLCFILQVYDNPEEAADVLFLLLQLAIQQQNLELNYHRIPQSAEDKMKTFAQLRVYDVMFYNVRQTPMINYIKCLLDLGVNVYNLPVLFIHHVTGQIAYTLRSIFGNGDRANGVTKVFVPDPMAAPALFIALLSALRFSRSVRVVEIVRLLHGRRRPDEIQLWDAIAWALFASGAKHSVTRVKICGCILAPALTSFREVLLSPSASALVFRANAPASGQLRATRFILDDPSLIPTPRLWNGHDEIVTDILDSPETPASDRDGAFYKVVLPGYGVARVRVSDVVSLELMKKPETIQEVEAISGGADEWDDITQLVELIGAPVRLYRDVGLDDRMVTPAWLDRILSACPARRCILESPSLLVSTLVFSTLSWKCYTATASCAC